MKRCALLMTAIVLWSSAALAANSVVVESKLVGPGASVTVPIRFTNDIDISWIVLPLAFREVTPGSFVTSVEMSFGDRLPTDGPLNEIVYRNYYADEDGACKQGQPGGFGTLTQSNPPGAVTTDTTPEGFMYVRGRLLGSRMTPGADATGSFLLNVVVTSTEGTFEVDTTCTNPANHLNFGDYNGTQTDDVAFTKGIVEISTDAPIYVTTTDDSGPGSLREAITTANTAPGNDSIIFTVAGVCELLSPLPVLNDATGGTYVDGLSAPGAAPMVPTFTIDASSSGAVDCFKIESNGHTISGLTIEFSPETAIAIEGDENTIYGNVIRNSVASGIRVLSGTGNTISTNVLHHNGGLSIDLGDPGVTPNDPGDNDTGPNNLLNYPEFDAVYETAADVFTIYGRADTSATVEVYMAEAFDDPLQPEDPWQHGPAYELIGSVQADPLTGEFELAGVASDKWSIITATATDPSGNTSEFAINQTLAPSPLEVNAYTTPGYEPLNVSVYYSIEAGGPDVDSIGETFNTFGDRATYDNVSDLTDPPDGIPDVQVIINSPEPGEYTVIYEWEEPPPPEGYLTGIRVDGTEATNDRVAVASSEPGTEEQVYYQSEWRRGDFDYDGFLTATDLSYLIGFLFEGRTLPIPRELADLNCNGVENSPDAVDLAYLIDHLFAGGVAPCDL